MTRVRVGDDRAFEALYTRYHRRIASYIQGMVHDHARAEDIAQDVFMSALRRMRETDRPIAFKPWVYEIAKNACIDQFRRARRAEEVSMDADEGLGSADYGRLVSAGPTPDVAVDHKQQIDHLRGAFGGLSETHHEILVMRELEGLSYREIGEKLGMTRPAVESTLFRARRRLTEEYDQLVTGERCVRVQQIIATAGGSALGARDKRRVARHVSYCQPCLRHARMSGMEASDLVHKPVRQKIAALLPLPAFLKDRLAGTEASFAHWSAQASSVDPGLVSSWGKAAATAATIALAGVGAGVATNKDSFLPGSLGGVTLESITGKDNPGGRSDDLVQAGGSDGAGGSTGAAGAVRDASAGGSTGSSSGGASANGGSGGGSSPTASLGGPGGMAGGDASGEGTAALAGAGGGATSGGESGTAGSDGGEQGGDSTGDDAGRLLPTLGDGGGADSSDPKGGEQEQTLTPPTVEVPVVSGESSQDGGPPSHADGNGGDNDNGNGNGKPDESGDPIEAIGDKSADVIGQITGG